MTPRRFPLMQSKRKSRRTYLIVAALALVAVGVTFLFRLRQPDPDAEYGKETVSQLASHPVDAPPAPGRWHVFQPPEMADDELTEEQIQQFEQLGAIGYLSGSREPADFTGVTRHDPAAGDGYNLYCSGHAAEATLTDMRGNPLHTWRCDFETAFPIPKEGEAEPAYIEWLKSVRVVRRDHTLNWRRVHAYPNGDLLAIHDGIGIVKLDRDSNLIWSRADQAHHDMDVAADGRVFYLTRRASIDPRINDESPVLHDYVTIVDANGYVLREIEVYDAFMNSEFASSLDDMMHEGDFLHTNTIEILDGEHASISPAFSAGNLLICVREVDVVAVIDVNTDKVVWAAKGPWKRQHQPTFVPNGNMILFDNFGGDPAFGRSRILEFDPMTLEIAWMYEGTTDEPLHSDTCGSVQRLANGNTLISETDAGRAIEVTPEKIVVWEFFNPHRAGEDDRYIASLFELIRLPPDYFARWLNDSTE